MKMLPFYIIIEEMENIATITLDPEGNCHKQALSGLFFIGNFDINLNQQEEANREQLDKAAGWKKFEKSIRLRQSDFRTFLFKTNLQKKNIYPSAFSFIRIPNCTGIKPINYEDVNFPMLSYSVGHLVEVAAHFINKTNPELKQGILQKLIEAVSIHYHVVSYHHFTHGFSLMHLLYNCLQMDQKFAGMFSKKEKGFVLLAAIAHDINHPGTNNSFELKRKTEWSQMADNRAVLQKMHIRTFFALLRQIQHQIFPLQEEILKTKQLIARVILSTDVSRHFRNLKNLQMMEEHLDQEQRNFAMEQLFHACDIGNPCLDFEQYMNWASLLAYEFNEQVFLQQENKVEVTEFLRYQGIKQFFQGQIGFINHLVLPLWKELSSRWSGFSPLVEKIQQNLKKLQEQKKKESK